MTALDPGRSWRLGVALALVLSIHAAPLSAGALFRAAFRAYTPVPPGVRAVALGDFDGDGALDLAVGNSQNNSIAILLNDGTGEFRPPSYITSLDYAAAIVASDLNGDGRLDLVVGDQYGSDVSVFRGRGDGSFLPRSDYSTGLEPHSIAIGDVDGDGRIDLVVANSETFYGRSISVLPGNGDGTFKSRLDSPMDGVSASTIALADFDQDGRLDLVAGYSGGATFVYVMRGLGDGRFGPIEGYDSAYGPSTVAAGDLNGDGHPDFIAGGQYDGAVSIHLGRGDGTFVPKNEVQVPGAAFVSLVDIDRDGHLDVLTDAAVMRGHGDGNFDPPVVFSTDAYAAMAVAGDLDGDGVFDLVTSHPNSGTVAVLKGTGGGHFGPVPVVATTSFPLGLAGGDIDRDGRVDLAVASYDGAATILLGDGTGGFTGRRDVPDTPGGAVGLTDLDQDGALDLVTASFSTVSTRLGNGTGSFGPRRDFTVEGGVGRALAIGDFNEDGRPDVVATNPGTWSPNPRGGFVPDSSAAILLGLGDGSFAAPTEVRTGVVPLAVAVVDLNRDGHDDLLVANAQSLSVSALLGNGDGTFHSRIDTPTGAYAIALATGDFDRDGMIDVAVANSSRGSISILRGIGDGTFQNRQSIEGFGTLKWIGVGDWDGDGILDLAVTQEGTNTVRLVMGHGDCSFASGDLYGAGSGPEQGLVIDLSGDRHPEIVVSNYYGSSITPLLNIASDRLTSVALALVDVDARPGRVRLRWYESGVLSAVFGERRSTEDEWRMVGTPRREGSLLVLEDRSVIPGRRYAYRLRSGTIESAETWVEIPTWERLAISTNFRSRNGTVSLSLASDEPAWLEVYDPLGRRMLHRKLERLGPGEHDIVLSEASGWRSGLYFARLIQGGQSARTKWSIVR